MNANGLLPCPFCGEDMLETHRGTSGSDEFGEVYCCGCGARIREQADYRNGYTTLELLRTAIWKWNRRKNNGN